MIKIAITPEKNFISEIEYIITILDAGWDYVHIRHPHSTIQDIRKIIIQIPEKYHSNLKLHDNFNLTEEFKLGGLHLNHRNHVAPPNYSGKISKSCHSIEELNTNLNIYEYVTLSPIYDSISKKGYVSNFTPSQLDYIPNDKVIALGGVTPERINSIKRYPFIGFAMLGYLFESKNINELKHKLNLINSLL